MPEMQKLPHMYIKRPSPSIKMSMYPLLSQIFAGKFETPVPEKEINDLLNYTYQETDKRSDILIEQFKKTWNVAKWKTSWFHEEFVLQINQHWLQFSPPSPTAFTLLATLYIVIMSVGIFGNALVIFMYSRRKRLRTSGNSLILNLAISDILMMLKMPILIYNSFYEGPALGEFACRLYGFIGGLTGTVSIATLCAISLDRYYVIKFPLSVTHSNLRIKICIVLVWIYGLTFSSVQLSDIGFGQYQPEGYLVSCSFDYLTEDKATKYFILSFFIGAWILPFSIISFSYISIIRVVLTRSLKAEAESFRHVKEESKRQQEVKLAMVVLGVIFLWFFSWTPYAVIALLGITGNKHIITPLSSMIPALFCKTASALDPYVYAISHPNFRCELKNMLRISSRNVERKVYLSHRKPFEDCKSHTDVEDEMVEVDLKAQAHLREDIWKGQDYNVLKTHERELSKKVSLATLLCFRPSFSNKTSSFRKLARTFSSINRGEYKGT